MFTRDVTVWVFGEGMLGAESGSDEDGEAEEGKSGESGIMTTPSRRTLGDAAGELRIAPSTEPMAGGRTRLMALAPAAVLFFVLILLLSGLLVVVSRHT